mgnify:CR=1 FL=1
MPVLKYGKYAGRDIAEIPDDYLAWMLRDAEGKIDMVKVEQARRKMRVDESFMTRIIDTGFKMLSTDPLTPDELKKLEMAHQLLLQAVADAGRVEDEPTSS